MSTGVAETPKVVRRAPKRASEFDSRSVNPEQKAPITMAPLDQAQERPSTVQPVDREMKDLDFDAIQFAEDRILIVIHRGHDPKFSPMCTDFIAVNGVPAEILYKNGWIRSGYLPRGVAFYTKRKYVEVLGRSKQDSINTEVIRRDNEDPINKTHTITAASLPFSVLEDKNPKGAEWLTLLLRLQA